MKISSLSNVNPFVIFWIGVLTGALLVGFTFLYTSINSDDYKGATIGTPGGFRR